MNPFTQGGWGQGQTSTTPSIFGALPSLPTSSSIPRSMQPDNVTYQFTSFNATILNCSIIGPQSRVAYRIVTETSVPSCTIWKDNESRSIAMVQWQPNATLEIRGVAPRQRVRDWLRLSPDQSKRTMEVKGTQYAWAPMDGFICLYKAQSAAPRILARVARAPNTVLLELTQEAITLGLLEPALVATVMFVCGHNID
ncbi:hypothetical protein CERSUDRAFT_157206 [Gelatoporia subvermispora B]|uniref:DUF6593 domain-containing protein n=1 Tax=Ceriporiopsis subvermispora (strain B) TaxID=914234 RepID=M2QEH6_CERS8|nr:hypothetical protein CERSUDRAFT_157206 [Gelatoporia subvermispora B]